MSGFTHPFKRAALLGALVFICSGCKPSSTSDSSTTTTTLPTQPPGSFTYAVPGTNQSVSFINDNPTVLVNYPGQKFLTQLLDGIPANQFQGLQTIHYTTYLNDIADNVYNNMSASDKATWQTIVGAGQDPVKAFETEYNYYIFNSPGNLMGDFFQTLQAGKAQTAQEDLYMFSQEMDLTNQQIRAYVGTQAGVNGNSVATFAPVFMTYSYINNVLNINGYTFNTQVINGQLCLVTSLAYRITPVPIPPIFLQAVGIAAVSDVNGNVVISQMDTTTTGMLSVAGSPAVSDPVLTTVAPGKMGKLNTFVSPFTPNHYQSALDRTSQTEMLKEIQILQADPKEILQQAPGAVPHGFSVENTK